MTPPEPADWQPDPRTLEPCGNCGHARGEHVSPAGEATACEADDARCLCYHFRHLAQEAP